ncbi:MAG TPA: molybdopterin-dependent oxidoreductase [Candidatus Binatia bacterium]|jgi:anaerobic selenocysteine-containing dehydrogenase|nr:molybdopterin-dependent oxidoreductase [Candidatus Binatia bacterium]
MNVRNSLFRSWHGAFTEELQPAPGGFGLGQVPARLKPHATTRSVCGFCSTGCSLDIHLRGGVAVNLTPTVDYPVNLGLACPKGWEALTPLAAPDRATAPLLRQSDGSFKAVGWEEAMKTFVAKLKTIMAANGPESVAFLSTGQICTEEMALLGALWKFGMGALHCDSNTRQCMATAHVAYKQSFGFDAPPFTYADFEAGDALVFIGANPCIAHPIMWQRVLRNKNNPQIIVVDPRRTETAMNASQHLALRPKSDLTLLYGVANLLVQNGWIDHAFVGRSTTGFAEFAGFVHQFTPDKVATETGLTVGQIYRFAEAIHEGKAVSFWWTMGVNQGHEATRTAQAIINLALMTGNIGRPGTGANSITGQCNAMGSRLYSNITNLFGGRDFLRAQDRVEVAELLHIALERIPSQNSWAYDQIVQGIAEGKIKGLWVIATNASHSWIDQRKFNALAAKLEFLAVQEMFATTETAQRAHLILPAAGWGEKEGTFINSERRLGVVQKVSRAPGEALSDFNIFRLIAHYWGCGEMFREWVSPEAVFQILKRLSAGQPCDITGIENYQHLNENGGIQWPFSRMQSAECRTRNAPLRTSGGHSAFCTRHSAFQERRLFADGKFFHADGRAKFIFDAPRPVAEPADAEFPWVLLTGRGTSAQWHTNTRTSKSAILRTLYPANPYLEINPDDAAELGLEPNGKVAVISRRARIECGAFITPAVQPGQVFLPMHYDVANQLTCADFDPHSRQPSYKHCAVRLERISTDKRRFG